MLTDNSQNSQQLATFNTQQIEIVKQSLHLAEELVDQYYKMSISQWLKGRYDIRTLELLSSDEIVHGPYAQIVRYIGKYQDSPLSSKQYDLYKICLQDHTILHTVKENPKIQLFPFCLYILVHELIHIVRFCKFLKNFDASEEEKLEEETLVHQQTREILTGRKVSGLSAVLDYYSRWRFPLEEF
jgi:hypothetical protein